MDIFEYLRRERDLAKTLPNIIIMDFGRPLIYTSGIVSKSGIRLVPENHLGDDPLDVQCCQAANEAAIDLLLGNNRPPSKTTAVDKSNNDSTPSSSNNKSIISVDSTKYTERHLPPPTRHIRPGEILSLAYANICDAHEVHYSTKNAAETEQNSLRYTIVHFVHHFRIPDPAH